MSIIVKYCPKCGYTTDNPINKFCPNCDGTDEGVLLKELPVNGDERSLEGLPESVVEFARNIASRPSTSSGGVSSASMGERNIISGGSGGVSVENTDNSQHVADIDGGVHISINHVNKTPLEILEEKKVSYRQKCRAYYKDGLITDNDRKALERYRIDIQLDETTAKEIRVEEREQSIKTVSGLTADAIAQINVIKQNIILNNTVAITKAITDLEGLMTTAQDDKISQMYYQLSAIVQPDKYIDMIESDRSNDDYWKSYWSFVAFTLKGRRYEAASAKASLNIWRSRYPEQNVVLLSSIGYLIDNNVDASLTTFRQVGAVYSDGLAPLYETLQELLLNNWTDLTKSLSPRSNFYASHLFRDFLKHLDDQRTKTRAKRIEIEKAEQESLKKVRDNKENVIVKYEEYLGDLSKALRVVGITSFTFNEWLSQDSDFANLYNDATNRIKERIELDENVARLKKDFIQVFKFNKCDYEKACEAVGVNASTYLEWKASDVDFSNSIDRIVLEYKKHLEKERRKKLAQVIAIFLLLGIICLGVFLHKQKVAADNAEQERIELTQQAVSKYESRIVDFNQALGNANNSNIEALRIASEIFVEIRAMEATEYLSGKNESTSLRKAFNSKAQSIKESLQRLVAASDQISSSDPEGARQLKKEENNIRDIQDYINIVAK